MRISYWSSDGCSSDLLPGTKQFAVSCNLGRRISRLRRFPPGNDSPRAIPYVDGPRLRRDVYVGIVRLVTRGNKGMRDRDIIAEVTFFDRERRRNVIIPISADLDHRDIGAIVNQAIAQRAAHTPEFHRPAILAVEPRQIDTDAPLEQMRAVADGADSAAIAILYMASILTDRLHRQMYIPNRTFVA